MCMWDNDNQQFQHSSQPLMVFKLNNNNKSKQLQAIAEPGRLAGLPDEGFKFRSRSSKIRQKHFEWKNN